MDQIGVGYCVVGRDHPGLAADPSVAMPTVKIVADAAPTAVVTSEPGEKLICQRQEVIGSLIQKKRVCMTKRNWERTEKLAQDELEVFTKPGHGAGPK